MPIITKDRYFGEGIYQSGAETPSDALRQHRKHVRLQRLQDLLGKDINLSQSQVEEKFDRITDAIKAADAQVDSDNAAFIKKHKLSEVAE